ncbi:MAG: hypothetical protein OES57_11110 [Acidimicrobiia bacterium]|nr:hypothetical protein [Acidimicrobiia bacterium]
MILIGAIAVGLLAAFVLFNYIQGVEDDLEAGSELVEVLVVTADIEQGTTGEDAARTRIERRDIPRDLRPANAVTDESQLAGLVSLNTLSANQVVVEGLFVSPTIAAPEFSDLLPSEYVTYSVTMDRVRAGGGFVAPGDEVNILVAVEENSDEVAAPGEEGSPLADNPEEEFRFDGHVIFRPHRYAFQGVKVIAVGSELVPQPGDEVDSEISAGSGGIITFAMPPEMAQFMATLNPATMILSLTADDYEPESLPPLEAGLFDVLPGEDPNQLTPYGVNGYLGDITDGESGSLAFPDVDDAEAEPADDAAGADAGN